MSEVALIGATVACTMSQQQHPWHAAWPLLCERYAAHEMAAELCTEQAASVDVVDDRTAAFRSCHSRTDSAVAFLENKHVLCSRVTGGTRSSAASDPVAAIQRLPHTTLQAAATRRSSFGTSPAAASASPAAGVAAPPRPPPVAPRHVLAGHSDAVTCLAADAGLDLVVSGAADGVLLFHTLRRGR